MDAKFLSSSAGVFVCAPRGGTVTGPRLPSSPTRHLDRHPKTEGKWGRVSSMVIVTLGQRATSLSVVNSIMIRGGKCSKLYYEPDFCTAQGSDDLAVFRVLSSGIGKEVLFDILIIMTNELCFICMNL